MVFTRDVQRRTAVVSGASFLVALIVLAVLVPNPSPFQYTTFRVVLALAAAAFATTIPGFLHVTVSTFVKATGAIAVFVIVYFFSPASIVTPDPSPDTEPPPPTRPSDTTISIGPSDTVVEINSRYSLRPVILVDSQPRAPNVLYFSSRDPTVAGVTRGGDVIALTPGRTSVAAEVGSRYAEASVDVRTTAGPQPMMGAIPTCKPFVAESVVVNTDVQDTVAAGRYSPVPGLERSQPLAIVVRVCGVRESFRATFEYTVVLPRAARNSSSGLQLRTAVRQLAFFRGTEDQPADARFQEAIGVPALGRGRYVLRVVHYSTGTTSAVPRLFRGARKLVVRRVGDEV